MHALGLLLISTHEKPFLIRPITLIHIIRRLASASDDAHFEPWNVSLSPEIATTSAMTFNVCAQNWHHLSVSYSLYPSHSLRVRKCVRSHAVTAQNKWNAMVWCVCFFSCAGAVSVGNICCIIRSLFVSFAERQFIFCTPIHFRTEYTYI